MSNLTSRSDSESLLKEYVSSESLRKHCLAVALAMEKYAEKFKEDRDEWYICGLLHDFDYEKFPDTHPIPGVEILKTKGYSQDIIDSILGHAESRTGFLRTKKIAKTLFAVDELCGLIVALSKVRPNGFEGMDSSSVEKALKKKGFAANVNRDEIELGIGELGVDRNEHFSLIIEALRNGLK